MQPFYADFFLQYILISRIPDLTGVYLRIRICFFLFPNLNFNLIAIILKYILIIKKYSSRI